MRTVFLLFDSLNRHALSCYGGSLPTPNFDRLAARGVVFDRHYVGSLPCMPARRDLHTGRLCFLHRSWGPLEPFDGSFAAQLGKAGTYTHLVSDHYHYWEDGGSTYHNRYTTWDFVRGQESDPWVAMVQPPLERFRQQYHPVQYEEDRDGHRLQGMINRSVVREEADFPSVQCFDRSLAFLAQNRGADNWLLHLETFDPHEPFAAPARFREQLAGTGYEGPTLDGPTLDWPRYRPVEESPEEVAELRANYAALVLHCDEQLGRLLDVFDRDGLWDDTALVMTTDHGFLLGEHDWWAKNRMPFYNEIAHIPLIVYHPAHQGKAGARVAALTQTTDIMPTLLDLFGEASGPNVLGRSLVPLISGEASSIREVALYGIFGGALNATDGRYTYFRYPADMEAHPLYEYTLMPMHNRSLFEPRELAAASLHAGFGFTEGVPVLRVPALPDAKRSPRQGGFSDAETVLYDLAADPGQNAPLADTAAEQRLLGAMAAEMRRHDAPPELFTRFGLTE